METKNHECYVSLEVAKLLKKAGFDWKCDKIYFCYIEDNHMWDLEDNDKQVNRVLKLDYCLLAPTLDVAQRWLREEHYFHIVVEYDSWNYACRIDCWEPVCLIKHREWIGVDRGFSSYEEALEAGIKKALELILEKGE